MNGAHRLSSERTANPLRLPGPVERVCNCYSTVIPAGRLATTEDVGIDAMVSLVSAFMKESSVKASDSIYSGLLNAGQMNDASVSGRRVGGVRKSRGLTFNCVEVCNPIITETVPTMESPKSGKEESV